MSERPTSLPQLDCRQLAFAALPNPIVVVDLTDASAALDQLRSTGVADLLIHLQLHPASRTALFARIHWVDANPAALALFGHPSVEQWRNTHQAGPTGATQPIFESLLIAAWERRTAASQGEVLLDASGRRRECLLQYTVPCVGGTPDWSRVLVSIVDTGNAGAALAAQVEDRELQAEILARANVIVWRARVRRQGDNFVWNFQLPTCTLASRLFRLLRSPDHGEFWNPANAPDLAAMDACSRNAMLSGVPGYQQEFRVVAHGVTTWLAENVSIQSLGPDEWSLVGVVSDVTARHEAEAAHERTAAHLEQLLQRADCMLWRARVRLEAGQYRWQFELPASGLHGRLFRDPVPIERNDVTIRSFPSIYGGYPVLEQAEMNERSSRAFEEGQPGYQQEFRVQAPDHVYWLQEQVSIKAVAPGQWDLVGVVFDVTARHEAEIARRSSEAQVRQILEGSDCMLWQARVQRTPQGFDWRFDVPASGLRQRLWGANDCRSRVVGVTGEQLYGEGEIPEKAEMDVRGYAALLNGAAGYQNEFRVLKPHGTVWLQEQVSITHVSPDNWQLIGIVVDSTARRQAELARHATEQRLQQLLTRADCLIWEARVTQQVDGLYYWSHYIPSSNLYRELFGADPAPTRPALWGQAPVPEIAEMHQRSAQAFRSGAPGYTQEFHVLTASRTYWLRERVTITPAANGTWDAVGVVTDISGRREAERALAAEKERLAVTLRAMSEGVITTDIRGAVLFLNRSASELIGQPLDTVIGRPLLEVCALSDARSGARSALPLATVLGEGTMFDLPPHTVLTQADGRQCLVAGRCAPVRDAASAIIGAVLVLGDITERQRLDEHLQRASKLESVGILAGGIAHDFNNILTAVMGNLSLALLDAPEHTPLHENLRDAQAAAVRARDLTHQLLTFAKGGDPVRSAVHLPAVITEVSRFALHGSSAGCAFSLPENLWSVDADKGQVGQIIQNLVINAVQAMSGGGLLRISARNEPVTLNAGLPLPPGDYVQLSVADSGTGIEAENLQHIFDPYFTTKEHGHGLGLATVYSIVRRHDGHIEVESELGRGTTFHIWLPALRHAAADAETKPHATEPRALHGRVLFMDDEPPIRRLGEILLRRLGVEAQVACDGDEVVRLYQAARAAGKPFDVVIMDLTVPGGVGGREALEQLRTIDPDVCAIVSSGYSSDPVLANYRAFGFFGVVAKPYEVEPFARVLNDALAHAHATRREPQLDSVSRGLHTDPWE